MPEQSSEYIPANYVYDLWDTEKNEIVDTTHLNERNDELAAELFFGEFGHKKKNTYQVVFHAVEFEDEQIDRIRAGRCPYCNSSDIEGGPVQIDSDTAWQEVTCSNCGKYWEEQYLFNNAEPRDG